MAHQPPVPPDQQSDKVTGAHSPPDRSPEVSRDPAAGGNGAGPQGKAADRQREMTRAPGVQDR